MDWMRLFALLIAVASVQIAADGSKKKIRIHLPQKVKHIHHHKKIYITNHHASATSQYAPAFLPSAEGAVAVPTNVALPSVASVLPVNSVELYEDSSHRVPAVAPPASKLVPLYRARGYYGPTPSPDWDDQEYDIALPSDQSDNSYPPAPYVPPIAPVPKRVKVVKAKDPKPKKVIRRPKPPKRIPVRPRPSIEDEHPVTKFHEQFYSDLSGSGTIRKVRKPQRVEKIVDGDTEHIHTYSEEHIHKVVYDDGPKFSPGHPVMPFKSPILAVPAESYPGFAVGSLGTSPQLEYAAYNPREVTHDHVFHDHGELPPDVDLTKEPIIGYPPKISYNSEGLPISEGPKGHKMKYFKATKSSPNNDLSYYESLYTSNRIKQPHPTAISHYESSLDLEPAQEFKPVPAFNFVPKNPNKLRSTYGQAKHLKNHSPYAVSSTIIHDYQPKPTYPGAQPPTGFTKYKNPIVNFNSNNYDYDNYASPSNSLFSEDKNYNVHSVHIPRQSYKSKKKSVSTQNIRFGEHDHQTVLDHYEPSGSAIESIQDEAPSAFEDPTSYDNGKHSDSISPTPYTIKETSPAHLYYTAMALKALYNNEAASMPEASNDNLQYAEPPKPAETTTFAPPVATTTEPPKIYMEIQSSEEPQSPEPIPESTPNHEQNSKVKHRHSSHKRDPKRLSVIQNLRIKKQVDHGIRSDFARKFLHQSQYIPDPAITSAEARGKQYGDKI